MRHTVRCLAHQSEYLHQFTCRQYKSSPLHLRVCSKHLMPLHNGKLVQLLLQGTTIHRKPDYWTRPSELFLLM